MSAKAVSSTGHRNTARRQAHLWTIAAIAQTGCWYEV